MDDRATLVLDEWFGPLDADGRSHQDKVRRWFQGGANFDAMLKDQYLPLVEQALAGELASWRTEPQQAVALILLLDQFTRNIFRGTPRMFAGDAQATAIALELLADPRLEQLPPTYQSFVCMPLMHAESVQLQNQCVTAFERLAQGASGPLREGFLGSRDYARRHRDIVARFQRFPHRNATLGRHSTAEEVEFLKTPGSSF